jgi:hypothetical protein
LGDILNTINAYGAFYVVVAMNYHLMVEDVCTRSSAQMFLNNYFTSNFKEFQGKSKCSTKLACQIEQISTPKH